jgi:hypothetical protein
MSANLTVLEEWKERKSGEVTGCGRKVVELEGVMSNSEEGRAYVNGLAHF